MNGEIKVGEMFAGIGGFRLGLERANNYLDSEQSGSEGRSQSSEGDSSNITSSFGNKISYRCVWANEWDKYACQIYRKNYGSKDIPVGIFKIRVAKQRLQQGEEPVFRLIALLQLGKEKLIKENEPRNINPKNLNTSRIRSLRKSNVGYCTVATRPTNEGPPAEDSQTVK